MNSVHETIFKFQIKIDYHLWNEKKSLIYWAIFYFKKNTAWRLSWLSVDGKLVK